MARFFSAVIALLIATSLSGCKTDSQLLNDAARSYVTAHPTLDRKTAAAITANQVHTGMTMEQAIAAWGKPVIVQHFNNNTEYWFFSCIWPHHCDGGSLSEPPEERHKSRATFKDGTLISWQD